MTLEDVINAVSTSPEERLLEDVSITAMNTAMSSLVNVLVNGAMLPTSASIPHG